MSGAGEKMPCPKGSSGCNNPTSNQIDILENNFKFYHAWTPTTFEEHEQSYSSVKVNSSRNETTNSILVSGLPDAAQQNCSESNLSEFFSAFGPVIGVEIAIIRQSYIVRFEYGSDGAQNAFNSQPIKMFGNVLNIELKQNDKVEKPAAAPFPLLVASPKHGAWYKKLPKKSYLKPSTTPKAGTMGKLAAAASQLIADNFNPLSTELSAPRVNPGEQQNKSHQKLPSSSLHSLLSPTGHDPLFDDESDVTGDPFRNPENGESSAHTTDMSSPKHFHCDDALPTWVWAPSVVDGVADMSVAEKELSNALQLGRASNSHKPLYALVSSPVDAAGEKCTIEDTNLLLLHKRSTVSITEKSSGEQLGSYTLYQARHPFLAPILSVTKCSTESAQSSRVESFVSVFDITPSCHQPLHELLRTGDLLTKPLFPGIEGHECKPHCNQNAGIKRQQMQGITSPFSWFQTENGDQELCTCRTIFDRGRDESNLTVQDKMFRAELRQFRSSTSTMFQMLTEQEVFDDLRKLRLLPQTSSYHPQVYTRFNQTSMMYKTGSTYHANVADLRIRFLALQLFHAVNFFHSKGLTLGDQLRPDRIFVDREGWIRLAFPIVQMNVTAESSSITIDRFENERKSFELKHAETSSTNKDRRFIFDRYDGVDNQANESSIIASASTIIPYPGYGLVPYAQWQKGHVTNLAYLLMLNAAAGRTVGDQINPPILPWVTDFTSRIEFDDDSTMVEETELESPWRDLTKSKYRLHKGDEQLDQSYLHASPSHHVPETISDLTYTVYRARCLPMRELQAKVRSQFVPEQYPNSVERLYAFSPDEASYEFYVQSYPSIFTSKHKGLTNLSLPDWCSSEEEFISYHRRVLETQQVSLKLHSWIDLMFGTGLIGERAILEKNVVLHRVTWNVVPPDTKDQCHGDCYSPISEMTSCINPLTITAQRSMFVQLFLRPHPKRLVHSYPKPIHEHTTSSSANDSRGRDSFFLRKQHDISMIGAIIQDCYSSVRVIPEPDVQAAIECLLLGQLDIKLSLQSLDSAETVCKDIVFPFPGVLTPAYDFLSKVQSDSFDRVQQNQKLSDGTDSDITIRSTSLEKVWKILKCANAYNTFPIVVCGLLLQTLLEPLAAKTFMENYRISRSYASFSFADKMCDFVIKLSESIPGELLLCALLEFFGDVLKQAKNDAAITEAIGQIVLNEVLISMLHKQCSAESFIMRISSFISARLCHSNTPDDPPETTKQLTANSIIGYFISFLSRDSILGTSVCCRYIIPAVMDHIKDCAAQTSSKMASQSLMNLIPFLDDDVVGIVIVRPIMKLIWSRICNRKLLSNQNNTSGDFDSYLDSLEVFPIYLLRDLVSILQICLSHMEMHCHIEQYYFQSTPLCLSQLLLFSFKAITSAQLSDTCYEDCYRELYQRMCQLIQSLIANTKVDIGYVHENLFPTVEALCSEVNDHYLQMSMKSAFNSNENFDSERNQLELPGVVDTCLIAREVVRVYDGNLLKQACPSALEFLAWVDSSGGTSVQNINNNKRDDKKSKNTSLNDIENNGAATGRAGDFGTTASDDLSMLLSSQMVGEEAIEMLTPRHYSTYNVDESDDECVVKDNRLETKKAVSYPPVVEQNHLTKQKRDLSWAIGVNRLSDEDNQIKYLWQPRMMATTSLPLEPLYQSSNMKRSIITCMSPNKSESLLAVGNSIGEVLVFDLRRHPPSMADRKKVTVASENGDKSSSESVKSIRQVIFSDCHSLLACDGGLHLWDIETGTTRSSIAASNSVLYSADKRITLRKSPEFVAFSIFQSATSWTELLHSGCGEVAAISPSNLYMIDMRCQHQHSFATLQGEAKCRNVVDPMMRHLSWDVSSSPIIATSHHHPRYRNIDQDTHLSSFNLNAIASHSDWVCVGSSSGHIHCFDRRKAKLLCCWKAHTKSIQYLQAVSRHLLLSVSANKTAVLWNLAKNPPQQLSSIYNIPGKDGTMNIASHVFDRDGIVSTRGDGNLVVCAVTGRKAVFQSMSTEFGPNIEPKEVKADRIVMSNYEGSHISSSGKFDIHSIALLPLRQLVLLGCTDEIHVCL